MNLQTAEELGLELCSLELYDFDSQKELEAKRKELEKDDWRLVDSWNDWHGKYGNLIYQFARKLEK